MALAQVPAASPHTNNWKLERESSGVAGLVTENLY